MRVHHTAVAILLVAGCNDDPARQEVPNVLVEPHIAYPVHFDGAWVMSAGWLGHMGVALAVSGNRYYYWMYSDIPVDADYPYTGTFHIRNDQLILGEPVVMATGESAEDQPATGLYSNRWKILQSGLSLKLHSVTDKENDHARSLLPDFQFDPSSPFRNQHHLKPERDQGIDTPPSLPSLSR